MRRMIFWRQIDGFSWIRVFWGWLFAVGFNKELIASCLTRSLSFSFFMTSLSDGTCCGWNSSFSYFYLASSLVDLLQLPAVLYLDFRNLMRVFEPLLLGLDFNTGFPVCGKCYVLRFLYLTMNSWTRSPWTACTYFFGCAIPYEHWVSCLWKEGQDLYHRL